MNFSLFDNEVNFLLSFVLRVSYFMNLVLVEQIIIDIR